MSAHSNIKKREGMEAEKRMGGRSADPEVSIDLDMTNERLLILRCRHPAAKEFSCW